MSEEYSERTIIASVVVLAPHVNDNKNEINDAQTYQLLCPAATKTIGAMNIVRQFVGGQD